MSADDEIIISIYSDGLPSPAKRVREAFPHRSAGSLSVRTSILRGRGLIQAYERQPSTSDHPTLAKLISDSDPEITAPRSASVPREQEAPLRCPHCLRVFFGSDSLPVRAESA